MKKIYLVIVISLLAFNCSDDNVITPPSEFNFDKSHGIFISDTMFTVDEIFLQKDPVETGNSNKLSVGRTPDFEAYFLIEFVNLPSDSLDIDSIYIELKGLGKLALSDQPEMLLDIYKLNEEWDSNVNTEEKWHKYIPVDAPYRTMTISLEDSANIRIPIEPELLSEWQTEENNNGFLIRAAETEDQVIKEFGSFNSQNHSPSLIYIIKEDTTITADTLQIGMDATVFDYSGSILNEERARNNLVVTSGYPSRSYLKFDFSDIPPNAIISNAQLLLDVETDNIYQNPNQSKSFFLRAITEAADGIIVDSTVFYNLSVNYLMFEDENRISLSDGDAVNFGQVYIQGLINDVYTFQWFSIQYFGEAVAFDMTKLYGSGNPAGQGPRLIVQYLLAE